MQEFFFRKSQKIKEIVVFTAGCINFMLYRNLKEIFEFENVIYSLECYFLLWFMADYHLKSLV